MAAKFAKSLKTEDLTEENHKFDNCKVYICKFLGIFWNFYALNYFICRISLWRSSPPKYIRDCGVKRSLASFLKFSSIAKGVILTFSFIVLVLFVKLENIAISTKMPVFYIEYLCFLLLEIIFVCAHIFVQNLYVE